MIKIIKVEDNKLEEIRGGAVPYIWIGIAVAALLVFLSGVIDGIANVNNETLDKISGGDSTYVSGPIISALVSIIKLIRDAGYDLGSGFRRMADGEICPLK